MPSIRTAMRRSCYLALPVAVLLIVPGFWLMPNHKYDTSLLNADPVYLIGFAMAVLGVGLAVLAFLILMLVAEE